MKSQNGWNAGRPTAIGGLNTNPVPGTTVKLPQGIRNGDVATVLHYVAQQFHRTVEPLHPGWCWGYHYKTIEGSRALSNHASGTAIDLNAPAHPLGRANTFTTKERVAIRTILRYCEGVVRWGGDYTGRKDDMHFEIVGSAADVTRIARKIRGTTTNPAPAAPAGTMCKGKRRPVLRRGAKGEHVTFLQRMIGAKVDGEYGAATEARVRWYQDMRGLSVDGVAGPATWRSINGM